MKEKLKDEMISELMNVCTLNRKVIDNLLGKIINAPEISSELRECLKYELYKEVKEEVMGHECD